MQRAIHSQTQRTTRINAAEKVHVVGAGAVVSAAYEQLRNAAEYTEEHMLLQRAIRRFYRRLFLLRDKKQIERSGEELAIELTQAGYATNDSIPSVTVKRISELAQQYYELYQKMHRKRGVSADTIDTWTLDVLAVEVECLLQDMSLENAYVEFCYGYYIQHGDVASLFSKPPADLEAALYVAVQRALLKSDEAFVRASLLQRYQQKPSQVEAYVATNKQLDTLFVSPTVEKLFRYVDRSGAPLRVLRQMIEANDDAPELLERKSAFLSAYETQIAKSYATINRRINSGIIKSVIFLIITKFIIGIAIEIPYDKLVHGYIAWTPLLINLFFPPLYMILLRMTLMLPGPANTTRLVDKIDEMLYAPQSVKKLLHRNKISFGTGYNVVYALIFLIVFGGIGWGLHAGFGFDLLHLAIFFTFLSAASFLGFRLSRTIRDIEAVDSEQNGITTVRDFLYMPFVVVGRFMNEKYSKVNIVALMLDMVIELPLKTLLRLLRQWTAFIGTKKDAL